MCKGVGYYEETIRACWILGSEKVIGKLSYQEETDLSSMWAGNMARIGPTCSRVLTSGFRD